MRKRKKIDGRNILLHTLNLMARASTPHLLGDKRDLIKDSSWGIFVGNEGLSGKA